MAHILQDFAPDVWLLNFPLKMLGVDLKRVVTVIRLASGKLIIHSSAPFTAAQVTAIKEKGEPTWLVDTLLRHDTFAEEGRKAFPVASYLAPSGFANNLPFVTGALLPPPVDWENEIAVATVDGAPAFGEVVMLHRPSRTLIVADLIFHFTRPPSLWAKLLLRLATVGGRHAPGVTQPFKMAVKDKAAFEKSLRTILSWDFDRIIVGHGSPIESGGKEKLRAAWTAAGFGPF